MTDFSRKFGPFSRCIGALAAALTLAACATPVASNRWLVPTRELVPAVEFAGERKRPTLDARMARYGVPGVSLVVIESDRIVVQEAIGLRDVTALEPVTPDSRFQAASISKPVAASGVMVLVDRGEVELDTPVNRYLESWRLDSVPPEDGDAVTVRALLSHSGGVSVPSYPGFERGSALPSVDDILHGAPNAYSDPVAVIAPQGSYRYSGGAYMVLQKMIEDVSGTTFERFMQDTVLGPAGMSASTFEILPETDAPAFGHDWTGGRRADAWQDYPQSAAAGLWSTPRDLARWLIAIGGAYRGERAPVVTTASARQMATRAVGDTGLGFGVHGDEDALHLSHAGWTIGYRSYMVYYPVRGDGAVIMTNGDAGHHLIADMLRTLGRARGWPGFGSSNSATRIDWPERTASALPGTYRLSRAGFSIDIRSRGRRFELTTPRGSRYALVPTGPDRLIIEETGEVITRDPDSGDLVIWGMTARRVEASGASRRTADPVVDRRVNQVHAARRSGVIPPHIGGRSCGHRHVRVALPQDQDGPRTGGGDPIAFLQGRTGCAAQ